MLCSIEWRNLVLMQYNDQWRHHRRWYRAAFESKAVVDGYRPTQTAQAHRLLADLLRSPQDFMLHVKKCVCAAMYLYLSWWEGAADGGARAGMRWRSSWASGMASLLSRLTTRSLGTLTALFILSSIRADRLRSSSTFSPSVSPPFPPLLPCLLSRAERG